MHKLEDYEKDGLVVVDPAELYGMVDKGLVVLLNDKPVLQEVLDFQTGESGYVEITDFEEVDFGEVEEDAAEDIAVAARKVLASMVVKKLEGNVRVISAREYVIHMDENQDVLETIVEIMQEQES